MAVAHDALAAPSPSRRFEYTAAFPQQAQGFDIRLLWTHTSAANGRASGGGSNGNGNGNGAGAAVLVPNSAKLLAVKNPEEAAGLIACAMAVLCESYHALRTAFDSLAHNSQAMAVKLTELTAKCEKQAQEKAEHDLQQRRKVYVDGVPVARMPYSRGTLLH